MVLIKVDSVRVDHFTVWSGERERQRERGGGN